MISRLRHRHRAAWWVMPLLGLPIVSWATLFPAAAPQVEPPALPAPDESELSGEGLGAVRVAAWPGRPFFLATVPGRDGIELVAVGPRSAVEQLAITPWVVLGPRFEIGTDLGEAVTLLGRVNQFHRVPGAIGTGSDAARCIAVYDSTRRKVVATRSLDPLELSAETCS